MKKIIKKKEGVCFYSDDHSLVFTPDTCVPGDLDALSANGKLKMLSDGSLQFDEMPKRNRHKTRLVKKLAHGRISETHDGAFLLTLKIFKDEDLDIKDTIWDEAYEAGVAVVNGI